MMITGERSHDPPKMLCFQAKGLLSDETLESLKKSTEGASCFHQKTVNLSGKRTEPFLMNLGPNIFSAFFIGLDVCTAGDRNSAKVGNYGKRASTGKGPEKPSCSASGYWGSYRYRTVSRIGAVYSSGGSVYFIGLYDYWGHMFFVMRALGELLLSDLRHHSFVDFVYDYMGEQAAFITGWTYWFCWISLAMADLTAVGMYVQYWLPSVPQWIPSFIALFVLVVMNLSAVKYFGEMEFWFALIKVIAILGLIGVGLFMIVSGFHTPAGTVSFSNLWAYGGWFPNGAGGFILSFQWWFLLLQVLNW